MEDKAFNRALEDCRRRVGAGESLGLILAEYPSEYRQELASLVPLTVRLADLGSNPSPQFQARLESRLLASYAGERRARGGLRARLAPLWQALRRLPAAVVIVIALLLASGGGIGVVQAADGSLPDSPLYSVKTARESLSLTLARNGESKLNVYTGQIAARGRELERAVILNKPRRVVVALTASFAWSVNQAVNQVQELQREGKGQPAARTKVALQNAAGQVEQLAGLASPAARPVLQRLQRFLGNEARRLDQ